MTVYETAQLELAAVLFTVAAVLCFFLCRWLVKKHKWPVLPTLCLAWVLCLCAAAIGLAGEPDKPGPPQVQYWMRFKKQWAKWTHTVKNEWAQFCQAVQQGFISVQGLYGDVADITNSIPKNVQSPKKMQLHVNLLDNPSNQNFKARPTRLNDNGDGTWTVEITSSREIVDEPALMMYLRRKSDGKMWWVEHAGSTFPSNTAPNAFSYTFELPETIDANLIVVSDEVLLGGPHGLTVEGLALVDLDKGFIYEGIDGDFIDGDGRPLLVRGGRFMIDNSKALSMESTDPEPMAKGASASATPTRGATVTLEPDKEEPQKAEPPLKLSMPLFDTRRSK